MRRFLSSPAGKVGAILLAIHLTIALFAPWIAPYPPAAIHPELSFQAPSAAHVFGTDQYGRDVFSRVLVGGRASMAIGLGATLLAVTVGATVGIWLGFTGGILDELALRLVEAIQSIPGMLFFLTVVAVFGSYSTVLVLAIAFVNQPGVIRICRSATLEHVTADYIAAARARGEGTASIIFNELWPNILDVVLLEAAMRASWILLSVSALTFLGAGISPTTPDWGMMVAENRSRLGSAPWASLFPAAAISSLVIGLNLSADALARTWGVDRGRRGPL